MPTPRLESHGVRESWFQLNDLGKGLHACLMKLGTVEQGVVAMKVVTARDLSSLVSLFTGTDNGD